MAYASPDTARCLPVSGGVVRRPPQLAGWAGGLLFVVCIGWLGTVYMAIWKKFECWTYEHFDRDIEPAALPGFEDLVRLWQDKRGDRVVPSWSDFDFYDFKGWHGRIGVYDISYDPFDYTCRLSGVEIDRVYDQTMTGAKGSDLTKIEVDNIASMEFNEMICRQMLISRISGPLNYKGREHVEATFVEFPLSDDGLKATHTLEALLSRGTV